MAKRKRYDDKFRASAVLMLEAAGYPDKPGALTSVAANLKMPHQTLSRWARETQNPAPPELVQEKRFDLIEALRSEVQAALGEMKNARPEADYRALTTAVGIMVDKLQLLEGKPTERTEHTVTDARDIIERRLAGIRKQYGDAGSSRHIDA
jgi:transposase-like protein